jgi:hypothetical protein
MFSLRDEFSVDPYAKTATAWGRAALWVVSSCFMPCSLRRCQPGQVPRDSLNPDYRGYPWRLLSKILGLVSTANSTEAAATAYVVGVAEHAPRLVGGENESIGFSEGELGIHGDHVQES